MKLPRELAVRCLALAGEPPEPEGEGEFQQRVVALAQANGWRVLLVRPVKVQRRNGSTYHQTPFGADGKGWPDLVCVRDRVVFAELKTDTGRTRPDQRTWLAALKAAGAEVYTWRPKMWQTITEVLK